MKLNVFFLHPCFLEVSLPKDQQTWWFSSEWVWLSRLARLWAYTRQVTSTDVWILDNLALLIPVAKGTNGERHWWLLLSRASPYRRMGFFCFSMREDTCRTWCSGTLCISQGNLDGWFLFRGCVLDVLFGVLLSSQPWRCFFLFQRPPNDGRKSVTIQVYSSSTTLRWGSGAQQSKVMKWWNQKCPTKTGVVSFCVGTFHDPKTGRESIKYLPRVHGNSSGWSYWVQRGSRKRDRSEKHDLFIRDRLWYAHLFFYNPPKWQPNLIDGLLL